MKRYIFAGLLAMAFDATGEVFIGQGDTYVFDFNLTYVRPATSLDAADTLLSLSPSLQNWNVELDYFANSVSESPFLRLFFYGSGSDSVQIGYGFGPTRVPPWPDLQGVIRATMRSGEARVESLYVQETVNGGFYSGTFLAVVPEPSTCALFMIGVVFLGKSIYRSRLIE